MVRDTGVEPYIGLDTIAGIAIDMGLAPTTGTEELAVDNDVWPFPDLDKRMRTAIGMEMTVRCQRPHHPNRCASKIVATSTLAIAGSAAHASAAA